MDYTPYLNYNPDFFNPKDFEDAKKIVLGHGIAETPYKWEVETKWTIDLFKNKNFVDQNSVVLDWGVGVGRISKELISTFGCRVIGVDISQKMIDLATENVNSINFTGLTVDEFKNHNVLKFTNVIGIWAFQHSICLENDLEIIKNSLLPTAKLFVFEQNNPCIPTWGNFPWFIIHAVHNYSIISHYFNVIERGIFPTELNILENNDSWWGFFENKGEIA